MTNEEKAREIANEYCYWDDRDESGAVKVAIEMAEWKDQQFSIENYKYYDPTKRMTREEVIANPQPVCVLVDAEGNPQGVLVQALDDKFIIDLNDFSGGKRMDWYEAMTALKAEGKTTFTQQQAYLILYLRTSISLAILSAGGKDFADYYWTTTGYGQDIFWYVNFGRALFSVNRNYICYVVRAITII